MSSPHTQPSKSSLNPRTRCPSSPTTTQAEALLRRHNVPATWAAPLPPDLGSLALFISDPHSNRRHRIHLSGLARIFGPLAELGDGSAFGPLGRPAAQEMMTSLSSPGGGGCGQEDAPLVVDADLPPLPRIANGRFTGEASRNV